MSDTYTQVKPSTEAHVLPLIQGLVLFAPLVLLGNEISVWLRYPDFGSAVLFPPYAILTAMLVTSPRRHWPWYILVASIAHAIAGLPYWPVTHVVFSDVANIARALLTASLLRHLFGGVFRLDSVPALAWFVLSAVAIGPAAGATLGAANVVYHDPSAPYWRAWTQWLMSNALTALIMLPAMVELLRSIGTWLPRPFDRRRVLEALLLATALATTCTVAFLLRVSSNWDVALLLYGPLPLLIWAALRFGPAAASLGLSVVSFAAIWGAARGTGPFLTSSTNDRVLILQLFLLLTALPVLCISAVGSARHDAVQLYSALLASLQDHVAILDARGVVLRVNDSWRRFADAGHPCPFDRVHAGDDYLAAGQQAIDSLTRAGKPEGDIVAARAIAGVSSVLSGEERRFDMEYEQENAHGREWYTMRVEALERSDGGAVVTRANISARRRAQLEIEEQRRELSHLARVGVLGQLSGALAHELSQPLSSILSNAEAARHLLRRTPIDVEELNAIVHDIIAEDRRAAQVIDGLRAMLKRGETRMQPVDTETLVREVLALAHAELITRRITATAVVEPGLPPILADRVQVQQVLLNLILNACEAMSDTSAGDRSLVLSALPVAPNDVCFSLRDRGSGIAPALLERLFEPFVSTKPEGLGLGLSIARTIVAAHGGRIWAENNPDGGATVFCVFGSAPRDAIRDARRSDPSKHVVTVAT